MYDFNGSAAYWTGSGSAWTAITDPPFTLAAWFIYDTTGTEDPVFGMYDYSGVQMHQMMPWTNNEFVIGSYSSGWALDSSGAISTGTLYHGGGVWRSTTEREAYLNGTGSGSPSTTLKTVTGIDTLSIAGAYHTSAFQLGGDVRVGHPAAWNTNLNAAEMAALAKGMSPLLIRPSNLVFYAPLLGDLKFDLFGNALSTQGTPSAAADRVPIIMPRSHRIIGVPAAAAGGAADNATGRLRYGLTHSHLTRGKLVA